MGVSQTPWRVLIAEDEALIRLDLKEMLEEEGYSVVGEAGGDVDGREKLSASLGEGAPALRHRSPPMTKFVPRVGFEPTLHGV